jgi:hypothetical protein
MFLTFRVGSHLPHPDGCIRVRPSLRIIPELHCSPEYLKLGLGLGKEHCGHCSTLAEKSSNTYIML